MNVATAGAFELLAPVVAKALIDMRVPWDSCHFNYLSLAESNVPFPAIELSMLSLTSIAKKLCYNIPWLHVWDNCLHGKPALSSLDMKQCLLLLGVADRNGGAAQKLASIKGLPFFLHGLWRKSSRKFHITSSFQNCCS